MTNEQLEQVRDELEIKRNHAAKRAEWAETRGDESIMEYNLGLTRAYGMALALLENAREM